MAAVSGRKYEIDRGLRRGLANTFDDDRHVLRGRVRRFGRQGRGGEEDGTPLLLYAFDDDVAKPWYAGRSMASRGDPRA